MVSPQREEDLSPRRGGKRGGASARAALPANSQETLLARTGTLNIVERGTQVLSFGAGYHGTRGMPLPLATLTSAALAASAGQLGRKFSRGQKKYSIVPEPLTVPAPIRQVACGGLHSAAISGPLAPAHAVAAVDNVHRIVAPTRPPGSRRASAQTRASSTCGGTAATGSWASYTTVTADASMPSTD